MLGIITHSYEIQDIIEFALKRLPDYKCQKKKLSDLALYMLLMNKLKKLSYHVNPAINLSRIHSHQADRSLAQV
jgi:hypothetical protein